MRVPIPKAVVVSLFNAVFASTKVHLDTYGPKRGTSWYRNTSYILLPTGSKVPIHKIPEPSFKIAPYRYLKYYLNDLDSAFIQATVDGKRIQVDVHFESQGEEIKGKCVRRLFRKWRECSLDMERDVHLDNTILSISFVPAAYEGSIAYSDLKVDFKTDVRISNRLCQAFKGICGAIERKIKREMTQSIEGQGRKSLNTKRMKQHVAKAVKSAPILRSFLVGRKVLKVESRGSNFIVTVQD